MAFVNTVINSTVPGGAAYTSVDGDFLIIGADGVVSNSTPFSTGIQIGTGDNSRRSWSPAS